MRCATLSLTAMLLIAGTAFADADSHRKAAEELLETMEMSKQLQASISTMVDAQAKANPMLARMRPTMERFFSKYLSYDSLKPDMINIYMKSFSEKELKEITGFYKTPVGKKMLKEMPNLMRQGAELGMKRVQDNITELQKMIAEDMKK